MNGELRLEKRLRRAGMLVGAGLLVQLSTLFSGSPSAFLLFALGGGALLFGGVLLFLHALLAR